MFLSNSQSDLIDYSFRISLDHIELEAEALQEPRPPNGPSPIQDLASSNKLVKILIKIKYNQSIQCEW